MKWTPPNIFFSIPYICPYTSSLKSSKQWRIPQVQSQQLMLPLHKTLGWGLRIEDFLRIQWRCKGRQISRSQYHIRYLLPYRARMWHFQQCARGFHGGIWVWTISKFGNHSLSSYYLAIPVVQGRGDLALGMHGYPLRKYSTKLWTLLFRIKTQLQWTVLWKGLGRRIGKCSRSSFHLEHYLAHRWSRRSTGLLPWILSY